MKKTFEIAIPTKWTDVSIEKYMAYNNSVSEEHTPEEAMINIISIFCDISKEVVTRLKLSDLKAIHSRLHKLISSPINKEIISKIEIDGITYGMHPKLDELTMGEYVDLETFAEDNDIPRMMSVLYRPVVKTKGARYDIEPYDTDIHSGNYMLFNKLSVSVVNPIAVFFWTLGKELLIASQVSLESLERNQHQVGMDGLV